MVFEYLCSSVVWVRVGSCRFVSVYDVRVGLWRSLEKSENARLILWGTVE